MSNTTQLLPITRTSPFSGLTRTIHMSVTLEQLQAWAGGVLIQEAMPQLSPDEREFIMTGVTPDEWRAMFDGEEV